jgi:hypothetical protein
LRSEAAVKKGAQRQIRESQAAIKRAEQIGSRDRVRNARRISILQGRLA